MKYGLNECMKYRSHSTKHHAPLYIMPPIPPIPPIPPPLGIDGSSLGISVITASAVVNKEATPDASVIAVRTTCKNN